MAARFGAYSSQERPKRQRGGEEEEEEEEEKAEEEEAAAPWLLAIPDDGLAPLVTAIGFHGQPWTPHTHWGHCSRNCICCAYSAWLPRSCSACRALGAFAAVCHRTHRAARALWATLSARTPPLPCTPETAAWQAAWRSRRDADRPYCAVIWLCWTGSWVTYTSASAITLESISRRLSVTYQRSRPGFEVEWLHVPTLPKGPVRAVAARPSTFPPRPLAVVTVGDEDDDI